MNNFFHSICPINNDDFKNLFNNFHESEEFKKEIINSIVNQLDEKEITKNIKYYKEENKKEGAHFYVNTAFDNFKNLNDIWEKTGLISKNVQFPKLINKIKDDLFFSYSRVSFKYFVEERKKWLSSDLVQKKDIDQIPEILYLMKYEISEALHNKYEYYKIKKQEFISTGILEEEQINKMISGL